MIQTVFAGNAPREWKRRWRAMMGFLLGLALLSALSLPGRAQKRSDRSKGDATATRDKVGPKRTDRTVPEAERVRVITKTEFIKVPVLSNKGYLSVVAVPAAAVTLTPLQTGPKKPPAIREIIKGEDGSLNLINLLPGQYKIAIEHPDYLPYSDTIQVDPARPETFVAMYKMVARHGEIRIGGAPSDAKVFLDDAPVTPARQASDNALLSKIPVGKHRLRISKSGYIDFAQELDVQPGKQSFVSAQLALATVTLSLTSEPGARVYIGNEERAVIPSGGNVKIPLAPGRQSILVQKDGFQEARKDLALSLANNPASERIELVPIPSSAEGDWQPSLGPRKWFPAPTAWRFDAAGALIRGDKPILYDTESNRDFNTYRDYKIEFDVVFANGKGLAWIARARDPENYYLFEISGPLTSPKFHFYVCRDGKLEWKDTQQIVEKMDKRGDSFHFIFEARGNRFDTRMTIASAPSAQPYVIGIFQDDAFSYGGTGFRAKDLSESLLQTFFVVPLR
jgi:hypothetical protein